MNENYGYVDEELDDIIESQYIGVYEEESDEYFDNQLISDYCDELYD